MAERDDKKEQLTGPQEPYGYLWFNKHMERRFTHRPPHPKSYEKPIGEVVPVYIALPVTPPAEGTSGPRVGLPLLYNIVCLWAQKKDDEWFKDMAELMRLADRLLYEQGYEVSPYTTNEHQVKADCTPSHALRSEPIPMELYCPACGRQHIDRSNPEKGWDNPPHRSHACQFCKCIWRPADVETTGVEHIKTSGKADTWGGVVSAACARSATGGSK